MSVRLQVRTKVTPTPPSFALALGGLLQRKCARGGTPSLDDESTECCKKRLNLQRFSANQAESLSVPPLMHEALRSPGQPLDANTRAFFEPRFGHDFGRVRVHADARAAESARAIDALAYTVGRDMVFGARQYEPGTSAGRRLLAHELTHVVQQGSAASATPAPLAIDAPMSSAEREAEQAAARVTQGGWRAVTAGAEPGMLQRQEAEDDEFRLRLPERELGQGLGFKSPRIGFDLPELQLDPQIAMQIRAIQFARGLLSIENIVSAAEEIDGVGLSPPGAPGTAPSLVPSPGQPQGGSPAPAGGLRPGQPLPARPPLVPRGEGPKTPRAAKVGDLMKAVLKIPAVEAGIERLRTQAESELRANWESLSGGERALVITQGVVMGAGVIAGVASDPETSQFVLGLVQGQDISIPGLPMTFQFNLTGPDQQLLIGLDVGALLPPGLGFGPRKKAK